MDSIRPLLLKAGYNSYDKSSVQPFFWLRRRGDIPISHKVPSFHDVFQPCPVKRSPNLSLCIRTLGNPTDMVLDHTWMVLTILDPFFSCSIHFLILPLSPWFSWIHGQTPPTGHIFSPWGPISAQQRLAPGLLKGPATWSIQQLGGCFSTKRYGIVTTENWNWISNNWNVELLNQKNNLGISRERNRWQVTFWWMQRTSSAAMFQVSLGCLKRAPNRQRLCNTLHFRVLCWSFKHGQNSKSVGICWKSMKIQKCCRAWYGDVNCPHRPAGLVIYLWAGPLVSLVWPTLVPQSILWVNICGWFCWWANLSWVHIH